MSPLRGESRRGVLGQTERSREASVACLSSRGESIKKDNGTSAASVVSFFILRKRVKFGTSDITKAIKLLEEIVGIKVQDI